MGDPLSARSSLWRMKLSTNSDLRIYQASLNKSSGSLCVPRLNFLHTNNDSERVRVTLRARPSTKQEKQEEDNSLVYINPDKRTVIVRRNGSSVDYTEYKFDAVLSDSATQADVYRVAAQPVVLDVLHGYNGTIMAYGQTGAGKTYTLSDISINETSTSRIDGIIPRSAANIFEYTSNDKNHEYRISMSYIQIYLETIQDLLNPESSNLQIREGETGGIFIAGVHEVEIKSLEDLVRLLMIGDSNRTNAFTNMNAHSSRSHAIVIITVEKKSIGNLCGRTSIVDSGRRTPRPIGSQEQQILVGKLFLVDLAGSERLKRSGSEGLRATEAMSVNMSLTALAKCISARADPSNTHVPFRDSKLTRLLQESLGGNSKTSLIINIAPCSLYVHETLSSLKFGMRAMKVGSRAILNFEEEFRVISKKLLEEMQSKENIENEATPRRSNKHKLPRGDPSKKPIVLGERTPRKERILASRPFKIEECLKSLNAQECLKSLTLEESVKSSSTDGSLKSSRSSRFDASLKSSRSSRVEESLKSSRFSRMDECYKCARSLRVEESSRVEEGLKSSRVEECTKLVRTEECLKSTSMEECLKSSRVEECLKSTRMEECLKSARGEECLNSARGEECLKSMRVEELNLKSARVEKCLKSTRGEECLKSARVEDCLKSARGGECLESMRGEEGLKSTKEEENLKSAMRAVVGCLDTSMIKECSIGSTIEECLSNSNLEEVVSSKAFKVEHCYQHDLKDASVNCMEEDLEDSFLNRFVDELQNVWNNI
uniref:Kinesin-like protein n=1 Tax=Marsilea vestita TaxID=59764 RepID=A0A142KW88_MARVE|nr:armadillo repeat-containing kinesin-like protein [Marsilea vestita]